MTKLYENLKTEKRPAKIGEKVKLMGFDSVFPNPNMKVGEIYPVVSISRDVVSVLVDGLEYGLYHSEYEVLIDEPDTITLKEENTKLHTELRQSTDLIESLREDHAASEEYYQQEIARLNGIIDTIQNYVKGLEADVR